VGVLIKNGEVVTATDRYHADVRVADGVIVAIGRDLKPEPFDRVVDASGCFVFPGAIDVHTHLDMPFMGATNKDDFRTGTIAAALGGTTGVIDFVIPEKGQPLLEALDLWHAKARGKAVFDYAFHMAVTHMGPTVKDELHRLVHDHGITSFKTFMAYKGALGIDDGELLDVMLQTRDLGALVTVHAENPEVIDRLTRRFLAEGKTHPKYHPLSRPSGVEGEGTHRAIALSGVADTSVYIVHLTCREALSEVVRARGDFRDVMAETCPQYLLLDDSLYDGPGFEGAKYVMSPPLRSKADQEALWHALEHGFIQTIATDHCPFDFEGQKTMGTNDFSKIPNGAPGIEDRLKLIYTYGVREGRISLNKFVEVMATNPAKIFGLYPRKGTIAIGADADLVVFDPTHSGVITARESHHNVDYSLFEGWRYQGAAAQVLVRGELIVEDGQFVGEPGFGRYLKRAPMPRGQKRMLMAEAQAHTHL
jgi:dihydropyrimidinase